MSSDGAPRANVIGEGSIAATITDAAERPERGAKPSDRGSSIAPTMAWAGAPSFGRSGPERVRVGTLEASVRALDPASRALLDLSLRRRLRDDDMAPLLRIDAFNLAWRRARAIERIASGLGLTDPGGLAQVRAALPYLPESAWCVPLGLPPGPPADADAGTVDGVAE